MACKVYWIHKFPESSQLGIMPRPRGGEWLEDEIRSLKKQKVGLIVSLLEPSEIYELELVHQKEICEDNGIEYLNFPIPDRDIPQKDFKSDELIKRAKDKIQKGMSVVVHCRMGIGRSSIIAGCVLQENGLKSDEIIELITKARGLKVPDTDSQLKWMKNRDLKR